METIATIGPSIHIKGDVTSCEPLLISGQVEGTVSVDGHALSVDGSGRLTATVMADTIVVSGWVSGNLRAGARIVVRDTATIDGDISAPIVTLAEGATVHGRVETAQRQSSLSLAS
jgi:cytoskeletal protein CcmA (bactofilin family)